MKNRGVRVLIFILIVVLVILAALYLLRRGTIGPFSLGAGRQTSVIPLDLQDLIPPGWSVQAQPQQECDFDGDGATERLLVYRYNPTNLPDPLGKEGALVNVSPFGGVIYDTQAGTLQAAPDSPGPYRASNIVPYKLLPDYYPGKGQGYLGETRVEVRYAPPIVAGETCQTTEINIYGYSGDALPTRLSVFRWAGEDAGYQVEHYAGDARLESGVADNGQVNRIVTYNRLLNHRSILCEAVGYTRPNLNVLKFIPDAEIQTIAFCFGTPEEPVYPEGVVVAVLRGASLTPTAESPRFLLDNAVIAPALAVLKDAGRRPINITLLGNPSSVAPEPTRGHYCTVDDINTADKNALWCGRERVRIETQVMLDRQPQRLIWILVSVAPNRPNADLYWRVAEVELTDAG